MSDQRKPRKSPRRRIAEAMLSLALGVLAAEGCKYAPEPWVLPCALLAKLVGFLIGSP